MRLSSRVLASLGLSAGDGPALRYAAATLSRDERQRVSSLVSRGCGAWDGPSARYALQVIAARRRAWRPGRWIYAVFALLIVTQGATVIGALHRRDEWHALSSASIVVLYVLIWWSTARGPVLMQRSYDRNVELLRTRGEPLHPARTGSVPADDRARWRELLMLLTTAVLFGFGLWTGDHAIPIWIDFTAGMLFAGAIVTAGRLLRARVTRAGQDPPEI